MINKTYFLSNKKNNVGIISVILLTFLFFVSFIPGLNLLFYNRQYLYCLFLIYVFLLSNGFLVKVKFFSSTTILIMFCLLTIIVSYINGLNLVDCLSPLYIIVSCVIANLIANKHSKNIEKNLYRLTNVAVKIYVILLVIYIPLVLIKFNTSTWVYASYIFAGLLPFVLWSNIKERTKLILYIIGVFAVLLALKRGPLLCMIIIPFIYFASIIFSRQYSFNKKLKYILFLIFCLIVFVIFAINMINSSEINTFIRLLDIENEIDYSRGPLIESTIKAFNNSMTLEKVFGHGFNSVVYDKIIPSGTSYLSSHNDFVEILYNVGITGLILYLLFLINVIFAMIKLCKRKDKWGYIMLASLISFFIQSNVSHLYLYNYIFHWWIIIWVCGINKASRMEAQK